MIFMQTKMQEIPKSCFDCHLQKGRPQCYLALKNDSDYSLKKAYMNKRHKDCPLVELKEE